MRFFARLWPVALAMLLGGGAPVNAQEITSVDQIPPVRERNLYLQIEMLKSAYLIAEPIYFYVRVESRSDRTEYLTTEELEPFVVADSLGYPLRPTTGWFQFDYWYKPFVPGIGDGVHHAIPARFTTPRGAHDVLEYYGLGPWTDHYLPVGKYFLWSQDLPSDTVTFTVIEPSTTDEKTVAARLVEYIDLLSKNRITSLDNMIQFYEGLLSAYGNSEYAPHIITRLLSLIAAKEGAVNNNTIRDYSLRLLLDYPATVSTNFALRYLLLQDLASSDRSILSTRLTVLRDSLLDGRAQRDIDSLLVKLER